LIDEDTGYLYNKKINQLYGSFKEYNSTVDRSDESKFPFDIDGEYPPDDSNIPFDIDEKYHFRTIMELVYGACFTKVDSRKILNESQTKLITKSIDLFIYKSPVLDYSDEELNVKLYYANHNSDEIIDLIFRLFLMSDNKEIALITYQNALLGNDDPRENYEEFIIRFWKWAQREKYGKLIPSPELKKFCCETLSVVCDNNSSTTHNSMLFINAISGWKLFAKDFENIKRKTDPKNIKIMYPI
jgi:hypothetical protein